MSETTILIADDNRVVLKTLENQLRSAGYKTLTALDGGNALEITRSQKPSLVIMDINFPPDVAHGGGVAWDGFKIIEWMRRSGAANTPVIVITSDEIEKHRQQVLDAGAAAIFRKPIETNSLLQTVEDCLEEASASPPASEAPLPTLKLADD